MPSKRLLRPVINGNDKLTLRRAVAYARMYMKGFTRLQNSFMLSVYVECYKLVKSDDEKCWAKGARMYVPRTTTKEEQMLYLETLTNTVAMRLNRDYDIVLEATPKNPKECEDGIQRPFTE